MEKMLFSPLFMLKIGFQDGLLVILRENSSLVSWHCLVVLQRFMITYPLSADLFQGLCFGKHSTEYGNLGLTGTSFSQT